MVTTLATSQSPSKPPTFTPPPPTLEEDPIDDLLYFSRAGELDDLRTTISELAASLNRYALEIVAAAADQYSGNTCLHMAAANNHVEIVNYLLSLEGPPETLDSAGAGAATAATTAIEENEAAALQAQSQPQPAASGSGSIPQQPSLVPSRYLEALINYPNGSGNTPLHWACLNGHLEAVKVLMKAGADPSLLNAAGHDAVYEAEVNDKSGVVEWVLNYAEALESGVGIVAGDDEKKDDDGEEAAAAEREDVEMDNADVLRDEGRGHAEREAEKKKEGEDEAGTSSTVKAAVDLEKLDLGGKEPTIR